MLGRAVTKVSMGMQAEGESQVKWLALRACEVPREAEAGVTGVRLGWVQGSGVALLSCSEDRTVCYALLGVEEVADAKAKVAEAKAKASIDDSGSVNNKSESMTTAQFLEKKEALRERLLSETKRLGLSDLVIGLTIVAIGTSAPEFAVTLTAAIDGKSAVSLGNIVGSNIFNISIRIHSNFCELS